MTKIGVEQSLTDIQEALTELGYNVSQLRHTEDANWSGLRLLCSDRIGYERHGYSRRKNKSIYHRSKWHDR